MPTREENRDYWNRYDWKSGGDEWSEVWGSARAQWWGCLYPRLSRFLPTATLLEIAPGGGRFTQFLVPLARRLILVDLAPRCIEICRERFADRAHLDYHVNDGRTLPMVADASVHFVFSFDSLVHADQETVASYLAEIARVLAPEGSAFVHHSNLGQFVDPATGVPTVSNRDWRDASVSAASVRAAATRAGLATVVQELVNWEHAALTDCFSLFARPGSRADAPYQRGENPHLIDDGYRMARIYSLWDPDGPDYGRLFGVGSEANGRSPEPGSAPKRRWFQRR